MRRVLTCVQHGLPGCLHPGPGRYIFPGVQIAAEAREITAADVEPDVVAPPKHIGGGVKLEDEFVDLPRGH